MRPTPKEDVVYWTLVFVCLVMLAVAFYGCAHRQRFSNGDRTVFGPRSYGDVLESDMPKEN